MRQLLSHMAAMKTAVASLSKRAALLAGVSACERMYPVYEYYTSIFDQNSSQYMRQSIDSVWLILVKDKEQSEANLEFDAEQALISEFQGDPSPWLSGEVNETVLSVLGGGAGDACLYVCDAVEALFEIENENSTDSLVNIFDQSLNILDSLVYNTLNLEITSENDEIVDAHPLLVTEMTRQNRDVADSERSANFKVVQVMRDRAVLEPIHGNIYFRTALT